MNATTTTGRAVKRCLGFCQIGHLVLEGNGAIMIESAMFPGEFGEAWDPGR